ncbi:hypothetical protein PtA15_8A122 [Puccinia triticina]|uniref:Uncharacterized protein n=1 Tax=Puccinia triticina TaxID=208348 RepID=A0ABY7CSW6_9BASI|nr:uncharacterized protein PtA15_8A122 [Puccinia triticina]WAQ87221.1 hypothetical protein PtA15_8A122 [Puccinia triticina]
MKDTHTELKNKEAGFKKFRKFAKDFDLDPVLFPLLADLDRAQLKRWYDSLMVLYRAVKDVVAQSGSEGIHAALAEEKLSLPIWDFLCNMHSGNQAANGFGHEELGQSSEDKDPDAGVGAPISNSDEDEGEEAPPSKRATPEPRRLGKSQHLSDQLTPAERALDLSLDEEVSEPPTARSTPRLPASRTATVSTPTPGLTGLNGRPPTVGASVPRRRGWTEEAPKKDNSDVIALRAMMAKTQETNPAWMIDERARSEAARKDQWIADSEKRRLMEEVRRDKRREAAARDERKDRQRQDDLAQAKLDREEAKVEAQAKERARDAERKADRELVLQLAEAKERQREADRKAEREEAQLARQEDARRYKAAQARQAYDAAMLAILGNLGAREP